MDIRVVQNIELAPINEKKILVKFQLGWITTVADSRIKFYALNSTERRGSYIITFNSKLFV